MDALRDTLDLDRTARQPRDAAFTLIELVVAMVLLALVFATIFPAVANLAGQSNRSSATSRAGSDASFAARLFESDVRQARGNRGTGDTFTSASSTIASLNAPGATGHDIVAASPTMITLNADVVDTAGVEIVTWELIHVAPTSSTPTAASQATCGEKMTWCYRRTVSIATGAPVSTEIVTRGRGIPPSSRACTTENATGDQLPAITTPRVFCYQEAIMAAGGSYHKVYAFSPDCVPTWRHDVDSSNANNSTVMLGTVPYIVTQHNRVDAPSQIHPLDRIVSVGGTFYAEVNHVRAQERHYETVNVSVRSREGQGYREAIMCGFRHGWGA